MKKCKKGVYRFVKAKIENSYLSYQGSFLLRNTKLEELLDVYNYDADMGIKDFDLEDFIKIVQDMVEERIRELIKVK